MEPSSIYIVIIKTNGLRTFQTCNYKTSVLSTVAGLSPDSKVHKILKISEGGTTVKCTVEYTDGRLLLNDMPEVVFVKREPALDATKEAEFEKILYDDYGQLFTSTDIDNIVVALRRAFS